MGFRNGQQRATHGLNPSPLLIGFSLCYLRHVRRLASDDFGMKIRSVLIFFFRYFKMFILDTLDIFFFEGARVWENVK